MHTIKGYGDTTVAEHTLALALAAAREVARMDREVRAGQWRQIAGVQLLGKTLGIIGMGGIGKELARLGDGHRDAGDGVEPQSTRRPPPVAMHELDEVLRPRDILCVCLALNDATRGFIDAAKLRRTKPGVIFVNTARADIVDNAALVELLHSGHIRHAALDVFSREPPDPADPILVSAERDADGACRVHDAGGDDDDAAAGAGSGAGARCRPTKPSPRGTCRSERERA